MDLNVALDSIVEKLKVPIFEDIEKSLYVKFLTFVARVKNRIWLSRNFFNGWELSAVSEILYAWKRRRFLANWAFAHATKQSNFFFMEYRRSNRFLAIEKNNALKAILAVI